MHQIFAEILGIVSSDFALNICRDIVGIVSLNFVMNIYRHIPIFSEKRKSFCENFEFFAFRSLAKFE